MSMMYRFLFRFGIVVHVSVSQVFGLIAAYNFASSMTTITVV